MTFLRIVTMVCIVAAGAAGLYACTIVNGLAVEKPGPRMPSKNCTHALVPERPTQERGAIVGAAVTQPYFAVKSFDTGDPMDPVGLDLDGLCTCPIDPSPCKNAARSPCDTGDAGRDNATALVLQTLKSNNYDLLATLNKDFGNGAHGLLLRVDGYNGGTDDPDVAIGLFGSNGVETRPPTWAVTERWIGDQSSFAGDEPEPGKIDRRIPNAIAFNAYVREGVLVASFGDRAKLSLSNVFELAIQQLIMTASISSTASGVVTVSNVLLTGLWKKNELYRAFRGLNGVKNTDPICQAQVLDAIGGGYICNGLDSVAEPGANANVSCDSASFGLRLQVVPAVLGRREVTATVPYRCDNTELICP
jgi:hypothetical protein